MGLCLRSDLESSADASHLKIRLKHSWPVRALNLTSNNAVKLVYLYLLLYSILITKSVNIEQSEYIHAFRARVLFVFIYGLKFIYLLYNTSKGLPKKLHTRKSHKPQQDVRGSLCEACYQFVHQVEIDSLLL